MHENIQQSDKRYAVDSSLILIMQSWSCCCSLSANVSARY